MIKKCLFAFCSYINTINLNWKKKMNWYCEAFTLLGHSVAYVSSQGICQ